MRSFLDHLVRADDISKRTLGKVDRHIDRAEALRKRGKRSAAAAQLRAAERQLHGSQYRDLRDALDDLADSFRSAAPRRRRRLGRHLGAPLGPYLNAAATHSLSLPGDEPVRPRCPRFGRHVWRLPHMPPVGRVLERATRAR